MTNARFIYNNLMDDATLTDSPSMVTTLPVGYIQNMARGIVARTTGLTDQQILGNFSANQTVSALVMWRHNLTEAATVQLQIYDGANQTGSLVYDSTAVAAYEADLFDDWDYKWTTMWFTPVSTCRSFRITLSDSANPDGYMQVSRGYLGAYVTPTNNVSYGLRLGWKSNTTQERTDGGTLHSEFKTQNRSLELDLKLMETADRAIFSEMTRWIGRRKDFFVSVFPGTGGVIERDHSILAKQIQDSMITQPFFSHYSQPLRMEES